VSGDRKALPEEINRLLLLLLLLLLRLLGDPSAPERGGLLNPSEGISESEGLFEGLHSAFCKSYALADINTMDN
jgi:hypothetical protein